MYVEVKQTVTKILNFSARHQLTINWQIQFLKISKMKRTFIARFISCNVIS
jgi:hypothetical protein